LVIGVNSKRAKQFRQWATQILRDFAIKGYVLDKKSYRDSEQSLRAWFFEVKEDNWKSPNDLKKKYRNASIIRNSRVVFNVKGNKYRLIVIVNYKLKIVFIRFIGTHKEYDKIDVKNI
jgi:mRNA interferase HigB